MAPLSKTGKIDIVNIGLLLISGALAFVIPFELFLFVYAVLGPLHYLTEISWLHDKNYYSKSRKDVILLVVLSLILTFIFIIGQHFPDWLAQYIDGEDRGKFVSYLTFIGFGSALFMAFIKKPIIRAVGIIGLCLLVVLSNYFIVFFSVFLPTLVHVFIFTSIFMLYGALRSRSNLGLLSVALHLLIPFALFYMFQGETFFGGTTAGRVAYDESMFKGLNFHILENYFDLASFKGMSIEQVLYESNAGIAVMRFIAFAYTYHYLNWFSKTEVIRWHKVSKTRFAIVITGWIVSVVLYALDYSLGFQWLFLLSFMHVMLEFPLNYVSFAGIFQELKLRLVKTA